MSEQNSLLDNIFTVTQITNLIKEVLETSFSTITIEGEISNWRPNPSGHIYFTLKDNNAQIKAVLFKSAAYKLTFHPKDGDKVRCSGNLSVYAPQGNYQIIINKIEPVGSGNSLQLLEARKQKLYAEGLFDPAGKKELPPFPKTIGVITSPAGAAIRDIINVTKRRNPKIDIKLLPALVQGEGAAQTIIKMIEIANFYKLCDVLIIGRGGGSLEDLLPFSEESVVRAVAASQIPTISAVGHEIDWAICDYAADKRAPTPSAAAEMAVPLLSDITLLIQKNKVDLYEHITQKINNKRIMIKSFKPENLEIRFRNIQQPLINRFDSAKENLNKNIQDKIKELRNQISTHKTILESSSPQEIFKRGYSMVTDEKGNVIRTSQGINQGDNLIIQPSEGKILTKVTQITK